MTTTGQYLYLRPANPTLLPRRPLQLLHTRPSSEAVATALVALGPGPLHLDLETTGLDATDPTLTVVGVGLCDAAGAVYLDVRHWVEGGAEWSALLAELDRRGFWAFNQAFDYAWLYRYNGRRHLTMLGCTSVLFRLLANESHPGQRHSLDVAMRTVLGWPASQKDTLDVLLRKHGILKGGSHPDKGRMWELAELEPEAFAEYCALDAEASWQLQQVLEPQARKSEAWRFATQEWVTAIQLKVEAQHLGVKVDVPRLAAYAYKLRADIAQTLVDLRAHPRLASHVAERDAAKAAGFFDPQVTVSRVKATKAEWELAGRPVPIIGNPEHWEDPPWGPDWKFAPSSAKTLARWQAELGGFWYREIRTERPRNVGKTPPAFNFESDPDLRWLLYERVYADPPPAVDRDTGTATLTLEGGRTVSVGLTDGGKLPVGKDVLPALGDVGALLSNYNALVKRLGYVKVYVEQAQRRAGRLHLDLRAHGAATGRWSGGSGGDNSLNPQQFPKVAEVLGTFVADAGQVLVDTDVNSLEPRVVATFSRDPTMLELFASGKPHDVYLYVAAALFPDKRAAIDAVYNLAVPTKDSVAKAKDTFKAERKIAKELHLACLEQGTLIRVQGKGLVPIEQVCRGDMVWDSIGWVSTDGAIAQGVKPCETLAGVSMTVDHKVLTWGGWRERQETTSLECRRFKQPSAGWADVWAVARRIGRCATPWWLSRSAR